MFILAECLVILFFGLFTKFSAEASADSHLEEAEVRDFVQNMYPFFQDVHVMIFIGFGFLMTFIKTNQWSALSFNWILSIWALQWGILSLGFWHQVIPGGHGWKKIELSLENFVCGDFYAASAMITFGAVLGKCNLQQLFFLVFWEMIFCGLNESICFGYFKCTDLGGSIILHTFGAYYGLAASYFFQPSKAAKTSPPANYVSQTIAMVGTIFLWIYWPSFNSVLASGAAQHRAIMNTVLSVGGGTIAAACVTRIMLGKLEMEVMLNATLAGGVVMGASCDLITEPWVAILVGVCGGTLSALGFQIIGPFLARKINLQDTCGVHSLHGMPGVLGAIASSIVIALAGNKGFSDDYFPVVKDGGSLAGQVGAQWYSLLVTLALAIASGALGGWMCSTKIFKPLTFLYADDDHFWELPQE